MEKKEHLPGGLRWGRRFGGGDWRRHGGSDGNAAEGEAQWWRFKRGASTVVLVETAGEIGLFPLLCFADYVDSLLLFAEMEVSC